MTRRPLGATSVLVAAAIAVAGALLSAAPAEAAGALTVSVTIAVGSTQTAVSANPANPTQVAVGSPTEVVTVANGTADTFTLTGITSLALTACDRTVIAPGASAVCTGPVTVAAGLASLAYEATGYFAADPAAVGVQASVPTSLFGVVYDLQTVFFGDFPPPLGGSAPASDSRFRSLPLGYFLVMHVGFVNASNVAISGLTRTGLATGCVPLPATLAAGATIPPTDCTFTAPTPVTWQDQSPFTVGATATGVLGDTVTSSASLVYGPGEDECNTTAPTVGQGERVTVTCFGFLPGIDVAATLHSAAIPLGVKNTGPTGDFSFSFVVPAALDPGSHRVELSLNGTTLTMTDPFTVTASLAPTGADGGPMLVGATGAVLVGSSLVLLGFLRRRRPIR
ncbi:hypothetical protein [Lacisediminihabitans profunda]|uniref:LPXTG cell wall anchor domain-containing protein n=1 Tax=Lacisediminihabitans profunda TaxID=2594790 RepID=A0A5C8UTC0_9MICO|nr:hypothetical protein [Lacisediminihabitans profunda]TXN31507.1 hypothetical protein FVP33_08190 [Lacisediminihabitans profunda]